MQTATIIQKLDYGYLVKVTEEEEDQQIFLDTSSEYAIQSTINIIKSNDKCVDYPILDPSSLLGFNIAEYTNSKFMIKSTEIVVTGPSNPSKFIALFISKMDDFYVAKVLVDTSNIPLSSDTKSEVSKSLLSLNINHLSYFTPTPSDLLNPTLTSKYTKFTTINKLQYYTTPTTTYFSNVTSPKSKSHTHITPYGILQSNLQFLSYSSITRGQSTSITITSAHLQSKTIIGYWCTINNKFKSFLPIHHIPNGIKVKIGSEYDALIWDIQQDTIITSLHLSFSKYGPFQSLLNVKEYLLNATTTDVLIRSIDNNRSQCDFYGIRSYINASHPVKSIIPISPTGTLSNILFKPCMSLIPLPLDYTPSPFTNDHPDIPNITENALFGPPLIIKPMITDVSNPLLINHTLPFYITGINNNNLYLSTFIDNSLINAVCHCSNASDQFIPNLKNAFTVGSTVLAVILQLEPVVVSLKWSLITTSINNHSFNVPEHIIRINHIPSLVATLIHHSNPNIGSIVHCTTIKSVASGTHVQFELDGEMAVGHVSSSGTFSNSNTHIIVDCSNSVYELVPYTAPIIGNKHKLDNSDTATILYMTPYYLTCLYNNKLAHVPTSNFNQKTPNQYQIGQTLPVTSESHGKTTLLRVLHNKRQLPPIKSQITVTITNIKQSQRHVSFGRIKGKIMNHMAVMTHKQPQYKINDELEVIVIAHHNNLIECGILGHPQLSDAPLVIGESHLMTIIDKSETQCKVQIRPGCRAILHKISYNGDFTKLSLGMVINMKILYLNKEQNYVGNRDSLVGEIMEIGLLEYKVLMSTGQFGILYKDREYAIGDSIDILNTLEYKGRCIINCDPTDLQENDICTGIITNINNGIYVQLRYNKVGKILIKNMSDLYVKKWEDLVKRGDIVKVKIIKIENEKIECSMRQSDILNINMDDLYDSLLIGQVVECRVSRVKGDKVGAILDIGQNSGIILQGMGKSTTLKVGDTCKCKIIAKNKREIQIGFELSTADMNTVEQVEIEDIEMSDAVSSISSVSMEEDDEIEDQVIEVEQKMFQGIASHEKLVMEHPNESIYWIMYMGQVLVEQGIVQARMVGERGIKMIHYTREIEVNNVYKSMINMEMENGEQNGFRRVLRRVLEVQDKVEIYLHVMDRIIKHGDKCDVMGDMIKDALKQNKTDKRVWLKIVEYWFGIGDMERGRLEFNKSLKSVAQIEHLEHIKDYSILEYTLGDKERSRTIISGIMSEYPKRLDIWGILVDMEIKSGCYDNVEQLFEMVVKKQYKVKQMKYIFEKWVGFEEMRGDIEKIAYVREKAGIYLKEINAK